MAIIEDLLAKLPNSLKPWGATYAVPLLRMDLEQRLAVVDLLLAGDLEAPYRAALEKMTIDESIAEAESFTVEDNQHAEDAVAHAKAKREAAQRAASIIFSIIFGMA
jgi:hypothetical protein